MSLGESPRENTPQSGQTDTTPWRESGKDVSDGFEVQVGIDIRTETFCDFRWRVFKRESRPSTSL